MKKCGVKFSTNLGNSGNLFIELKQNCKNVFLKNSDKYQKTSFSLSINEKVTHKSQGCSLNQK